MKRSLIAAVTAAATFFSVQSVWAAGVFKDISGSKYSWCAEQIEKMHDEGYIDGVSDTEFAPDSQVTKLQGICLFSRAMGSRASVNEAVLDLAHSKYDKVLKGCSLAWGQDELAYMMYQGALNTADLTTYVTGDRKNKPMTRGEAAVIITKAMGGEREAKALTGVELKYTDLKSIPSNILQYVKYVSEKGIMNGMDDGSFSANGTLTRAQTAVILARAVDMCDYGFVRGNFRSYNEETKEVTLSLDGVEKTYAYNENIKFSIKGELSEIADIPENVPVIIRTSGDELAAVDALSETPDEIITVIYSSSVTSGSITSIKVKETASATKVKTYTCIENVPVTYKGSPATLSSLQAGDQITLTLSGGKVQSISGAEKSITISNATVTALDIDDEGILTMTISSGNPDYDGKSYVVEGDAVVKKNASDKATMADVYVGDKVKLEIRYGKVVKVEATSTYSSATGILTKLIISDQPSITIKSDGKEKTYQIPQDCKVTVNNEEAELYDFRVGDSIQLTTQSNAVTKIACSKSVINTEGKVGGTVLAVNPSYGFISVMAEGAEFPVTVFCRDNNTTFIDEKGTALKMNTIKNGDTVECRGTTSNGAFVSTLVIVTRSGE